jgi:pimeloyl-ACP methyl ester carboxylesterase
MIKGMQIKRHRRPSSSRGDNWWQSRAAGGDARTGRFNRWGSWRLSWNYFVQAGLLICLMAALLLEPKSAAADPARTALRQVTCWFKAPSKQVVTCYRLQVPEVRQPQSSDPVAIAGPQTSEAGRPSVMMLDLPVVVISTPGDRRHDDPVVYISGGPGDGDWVDADRIGYWWHFLADNPWLRHRDLILFDQRGVGMTEPRADCPELAALNVSSLSLGNDHQRAAALAQDAAHACLLRLQREGHDAGAYTTQASAADLHDIFKALGLSRWNIYGLSYGTRLALTYLRLYPDDIRTVLLDSVYPPQVRFLEDDAWRTDRAFRLLFEACAQDSDCRGWYPDLPGRLQALVDRLNKTPLQVHHANPDGGADLAFPITGETLLTHLFFNLYNRGDMERVPQIIDLFDRNLAKPIAREVDQLIDELHDRPDWGDAMSTTIDCAEDVPFNDLAKVRANYAASSLLRSFADADPAPLCSVWVKQQPIAAMDQPVDSDVPSLVFAGLNDPVTPPIYAHLAASHLRNAYYFEFPAIGHDVIGNTSCAGRLVEDFLNQPDRPPSDTCFGRLPAFNFEPPIDG